MGNAVISLSLDKPSRNELASALTRRFGTAGILPGGNGDELLMAAAGPP